MNKFILAVIGLPGAGKTEAINFFIEKLNCPKIYFGDVTFDELKNQGLEVNEANERKIGEGLREQHGMAAYAVKILPKIKAALKNNDIVLVESLYGWEEFLILKKEFGDDLKLVAVYASPQTRHNRLKNRSDRPLTATEAQSRDYSQIENLHQGGPIALADFTVINEQTIKELHHQLNEILKNIL